MNGDMPHDGGHGGGGHAVGEELMKTGKYEKFCHILCRVCILLLLMLLFPLHLRSQTVQTMQLLPPISGSVEV